MDGLMTPWISEGPHGVGPMPGLCALVARFRCKTCCLLGPQKTGETGAALQKPGFNSITIHQPQMLKAFLELVKLVNPILFHTFNMSVKDLTKPVGSKNGIEGLDIYKPLVQQQCQKTPNMTILHLPTAKIQGKVFYNFFPKNSPVTCRKRGCHFLNKSEQHHEGNQVTLQNGQTLRLSPSFGQSQHYHGNLKVTLNAPPSMKQGLMNSPPSLNNLMTLVSIQINALDLEQIEEKKTFSHGTETWLSALKMTVQK